MMDIVFEELVANVPAMLVRMQEYLGVPVVSIAPGTQRIEKRLLSEAIVNYEDLKRAFQGSEWTTFFED
ncbi:hypothetical protein Pan216_18970 [Planctomycetes bacterium Pan216]|uniref:Uncharacterized protein n=1 Tax=Kolteria novifilia TaxID=2527975 RepID=A0A518B289_9BACT|nr:hypothetical protein Pan216_18970 [Planctomycetes bacterium Pan216]